jgi:hypothetical protein
MTPRIDAEVNLVKARFPDLIYKQELGWVYIPKYGAFKGWQPTPMPVAFQINPSHPGAAPYGFYTPNKTRYEGSVPQNYTEPAATSVPFEGKWSFFSWSSENWRPAAEIHAGSNLFNWVLSFAQRLRGGV